MTGSPELPAALAEIRDDFLALEQRDRLLLLLDFSNELPELPARYADHPDLLERVEECQSPVFIFVDVDDADVVHLFATAPAESPTTRGFASILAQGLEGASVDEALTFLGCRAEVATLDPHTLDDVLATGGTAAATPVRAS